MFDAEQKRVMKLEAMNGPTTRRLYQSVTDAYFKHSRDAGDVDIQVTGDEVIQVMGGRCLKVLRNMREIEDDLIPSVNSVMVGTDLATALVNRGLGEEIAIHKYEFRQDKEHKKQVVEIRQVGTKELTHNDSDVPVRGLLVIVHLTGADAHCFLVKTDVHKSREDWWNKYTDEVVKELTAEAHQRSWEIHATKEGRVEISDKAISGLKICGIPGRETPQTLAEALRGIERSKQQSAKTEALIDFWDAYTTEGKIIQLASGRHLRAILKLLNAHETYAIVAHDVEGQDPMTATVYTDGLVGDKSCTPQKRTVTIAEEEEEIVQKCTRFLRGTKGWSLPIISTGTAARLGFRAILPLTDVILSNVQGAHNGVKTAASTNMKITAADVEGLDETYDGCYVAMRMTEGSLAEQMNESTYWRWRAEQTEIVYGEADGRLQERMIECVQEAEGCVQAVLYTRDEHIVEMSGEEVPVEAHELDEEQCVQPHPAEGEEDEEQLAQPYPEETEMSPLVEEGSRTVMESVVTGLTSAVKALGLDRVTGRTPAKPDEEETHRDWPQTETEKQYDRYSRRDAQKGELADSSPDTSVAGSTAEEFASRLWNAADSSDDEEQYEEQTELEQVMERKKESSRRRLW